MIVTGIMAGIIGAGVAHMTKELLHNDNTLEGKLTLIFKRNDICIETKEKNKRIKLYPTLTKITWNGNNKVLWYKMPTGMGYLEILSKFDKICDSLGSEIIPKQLEGDYKSDFNLTVLSGHLKDKILYTNEAELVKSKPKGLWIILGWSRRGIEMINLAEPHSPHLLIGGTTGSGKSTLFRLIGVTLHYNYTPDELELWLADLKENAEFSIFSDSVLVKEKISQPREALRFFAKLLKTTQDRYVQITNAGYKDIEEYNESEKIKMKRIILMIDELAMLEGSDDTDEMKEFKLARLLFKQIVAIGRACGVAVIVASQRPSAEILDGTLKNNIPCVCGFRTRNAVSSRIILGEKDDRLSRIDPEKPGRCIIQNIKEVYAQVPLITTQQAKILLSPYQSTTINITPDQEQYEKSAHQGQRREIEEEKKKKQTLMKKNKNKKVG